MRAQLVLLATSLVSCSAFVPAPLSSTLSRSQSVKIRRISCSRMYATKEVEVEFETNIDPDFKASMNEVCNKVVRAAQANDEKIASEVKAEISDLLVFLTGEGEVRTTHFLQQLVAILNHELPRGATELRGAYKNAYNRLTAALTGTVWRIGKEEDLSGSQEFAGNTQRSAGAEGASITNDSGVKKQKLVRKKNYYEVLNVAKDASQADIKVAYRKLAMKVHPDVNDAEDAHDMFVVLSKAYDVLYDETARRNYDLYGERGLDGFSGHASDAMWDELGEWNKQNRKPKKQGKRDRARAVVGKIVRDGPWEGWSGVPEHLRSGVAQFGDIVKYPLSDVIKANLQDGRDYGLGVVVGRNIDRGDASKVPTESLELCEVEPLEYLDGRWRPDTIGVGAYPKLTSLEVVEVLTHEVGGVGDTGGWYTLVEDLSEYAPMYEEEMMV